MKFEGNENDRSGYATFKVATMESPRVHLSDSADYHALQNYIDRVYRAGIVDGKNQVKKAMEAAIARMP